jgi:type I restriction enzyme R subunit
MTFNRGDPKEIFEYLEELKKRFKNKEIEDILKEIIEKFKNEEYPKILIVTDMLLTGFDAPILQVMYLDKPIKGHRLLQAIARTNRPNPEREKTAGIIVDYVGILEKLNKALSFYSKLEMEDLTHGLRTFVNYEEEFLKNVGEVKRMIGDVEIKYDREYLEKIITKLVINKREKNFLEKYKELRRNFEMLGPTRIKLNYREYFKFLTAIYVLFRKIRCEDEYMEELKRFYKKVVDAIYKSTEIETIVKSFPEIKVDEKYINKIENNLKSTESRVFNRLTVIRYVLREKPRTPVYESIAMRVENLIKRWRDRKIKIDDVYKDLKKVFIDLVLIDKRKSELGLNDAEYSILKILEESFKDKKDLVKEVKMLYKKIEPELFKGWVFKKTATSKVEREIRLFIIRLGKLPKKERDDISAKILQTLKNY